MFVVEVGALITTIVMLQQIVTGTGNVGFTLQISCGCGSPWSSPTSPRRWPRRAARPRPTRCARPRRRRRPGALRNGREETCSSSDLRKGDIVIVREGEIIPGDGEVIEGVAYVNEAAITGESAPVLKEPGTDIRSSVTGGTQVVSDYAAHRDQRRSGRDVPGSHDRAGRGRRAPEDAERDRAVDPAGGPDDRVPAGGRHAGAVRHLRRVRPCRRSS